MPGHSVFDAPVRLFLVAFTGVIILGLYLSYMDHQTDTARGTAVVKPYSIHRYPWLRDLDLRKLTERSGHYFQDIHGRYIVRYTLIPRLQKYASSLLGRYEVPYGAIMMMDIPSGRVLVMAGYSSREPNLSIEEMTLRAWAPSASVIKVVTVSALLKAGISPQTRTCYRGGHGRLQVKWLEDSPQDDQCQDLTTAFAESTNQVFAKLARRLTPSEFKQTAAAFGYGPPLPFEFPVEMGEIRMDPKDPYSLPLTAAGFGHTTLSVYHGLFMAGIIAGDGTPVIPHIVDEVVSSRDSTPLELPSPPSLKPVLTTEQAATIRNMMKQAVVRGTAREGFFMRNGKPLVPEGAGGKTGTLARKKPQYLLYTWFVGLSPADRPRVALSVLIVSPLKWRIKASHAAAWLLREYWNMRSRQKRQERR